jgi:hypothetical protein
MSSSNVHFVLSAFENSFMLSTAAAIPIQTLQLTTHAKLTLTTVVPASTLQQTFFFRTDNPITSDASFVYYYTDMTKWPAAQTDLNPKNGTISTGFYVANDNVSKDFIRDIARQLFGTYLGADLFTNEDSVVTNINAECDTVASTIRTLLGSIDKTAGLGSMAVDGSNNKYMKDDLATSNITRELMNQLITTAPTRFVRIDQNYKYNATDDGFYRMPILEGDTITFKLTLAPSSSQTTVVNTGSAPLMDVRTYTVILNVGPN